MFWVVGLEGLNP